MVSNEIKDIWTYDSNISFSPFSLPFSLDKFSLLAPSLCRKYLRVVYMTQHEATIDIYHIFISSLYNNIFSVYTKMISEIRKIFSWFLHHFYYYGIFNFFQSISNKRLPSAYIFLQNFYIQFWILGVSKIWIKWYHGRCVQVMMAKTKY